MLTFEPAAAAKIGGVLPTAPMSMAPALAASSSGGPLVNVDQAMWYGVPLSRPAAVSRDWDPPFWSPPRSMTDESWATGPVPGSFAGPAPAEDPPAQAVSRSGRSRTA